MILRIAGYFRSTRAVSAMEYAAIVGIIIVGLSAALVTFRGEIEGLLTRVQGNIATIAT